MWSRKKRKALLICFFCFRERPGTSDQSLEVGSFQPVPTCTVHPLASLAGVSAPRSVGRLLKHVTLKLRQLADDVFDCRRNIPHHQRRGS